MMNYNASFTIPPEGLQGILEVDEYKYLGIRLAKNKKDIVLNSKKSIAGILSQVWNRAKIYSAETANLILREQIHSVLRYHGRPLLKSGLASKEEIDIMQRAAERSILGFGRTISNSILEVFREGPTIASKLLMSQDEKETQRLRKRSKSFSKIPLNNIKAAAAIFRGQVSHRWRERYYCQLHQCPATLVHSWMCLDLSKPAVEAVDLLKEVPGGQGFHSLAENSQR